jgi:hypothetical protein
MKLTKLDSYDYVLLPGVIRITMSGTNDPDIVDIMSEIQTTGGRIYVEGYYFEYLDNYRIYSHDNASFMELDVVEVA